MLKALLLSNQRPIMTAHEQLSFNLSSLEKLSCEFITAAKELMTK
jgi:hypothetical protein